MPMLKQLLQRKSAEARQSVAGQPLPVAANSRNLQSCPHYLRFRSYRGLTATVVLRAMNGLMRCNKRARVFAVFDESSYGASMPGAGAVHHLIFESDDSCRN